MRYYLTLSVDGSKPAESSYYKAYEIDEKFHTEINTILYGLKDYGRCKQL
jgi:hypothetical protein